MVKHVLALMFLVSAPAFAQEWGGPITDPTFRSGKAWWYPIEAADAESRLFFAATAARDVSYCAGSEDDLEPVKVHPLLETLLQRSGWISPANAFTSSGEDAPMQGQPPPLAPLTAPLESGQSFG